MGRAFNFAPPNTQTRTTLHDLHGNVILEVGYEEYMIVNPDGSITQQRNHENIQTVDGSCWNASFLAAKPPLLLGCCQDCRAPRFLGLSRHEPSHGIVILRRAKLCASCGRLCCPSHIRRCPGDRLRRRRPCALKYRLTTMLKSLVYAYREEN